MAQGNQQFRCSGDCIQCNPMQRQYCASQFAFQNRKTLEAMQESIVAMQCTIDELKTKIESIQNAESDVFDPTIIE